MSKRVRICMEVDGLAGVCLLISVLSRSLASRVSCVRCAWMLPG